MKKILHLFLFLLSSSLVAQTKDVLNRGGVRTNTDSTFILPKSLGFSDIYGGGYPAGYVPTVQADGSVKPNAVAVQSANNGTSLTGSAVRFGDNLAGTGQPGALTTNRFLNQNGNEVRFVGAAGSSFPAFRVKDNGNISSNIDLLTDGNFRPQFYTDYANNTYILGTPTGAAVTSTAANRIIIGSGDVSAGVAASFGFSNTIAGGESYAFGQSNTITSASSASVIAGNACIVTAYNCMGMGQNLTLSGTQSLGFQINGSNAGQYGSMVLGESNVITGGGHGTISAGYSNTTSGSNGSITIGNKNQMANGFASTQIGACNQQLGSSIGGIQFGGFCKSTGGLQINAGYGGVHFTSIGGAAFTPGELLYSVGNGYLTDLTDYSDFSQENLVVRSNAVTLLHGGLLQVRQKTLNNEAQSVADCTPQSVLEVVSTKSGVIVPRLTSAQITTWQSSFNVTTDVTGDGGAGDEKHSRQGEMVFDLTGNYLKQATWNGTIWVFAHIGGTSQRYQPFIATSGQTVFNLTSYTPPAQTGDLMPIRVVRNGVNLIYSAAAPTVTEFTYTGAAVTTFANALGDKIVIYYEN